MIHEFAAGSDLLHIGLITYNRAAKLERTLAALARSSLRMCRITIYDNTSTDNTPEVVSRHVGSFPRLESVRRHRNIGACGNLIAAIADSKATYCWILCDDDLLDAEACDTILPELCKNEADVLLINAIGLEGFTEGYRGSLRDLQEKGWRYYWLAAFLPSTIYRTSLISDSVIRRMQRHIHDAYPHAELAYAFSMGNARAVVCASKIMERQASNDIGTDWVAYTCGWTRSIEHFADREEQVRAFWQRFGPPENWWKITMKSAGYIYAYHGAKRFEILALFPTFPWKARIFCSPLVLLLFIPRPLLRFFGRTIKPDAKVEHNRLD